MLGELEAKSERRIASAKCQLHLLTRSFLAGRDMANAGDADVHFAVHV